MIFFSSDAHFFHKAILKHCNRPFSSVEEMNQVMIERWNSVVGKKDQVMYLGDFSFGKLEQTIEILKQLNGYKFLIEGNHDRTLLKKPEFVGQFGWVKPLHTIKVADNPSPSGSQTIVLCHYAMKVWDKSHYGSYMLHGHSHGNLLDDPNSLSFDIGVDAWDFYPVSFVQIEQKMKLKTWKLKETYEKVNV
jgi:calcineurin-like phosphoesterase family protein